MLRARAAAGEIEDRRSVATRVTAAVAPGLRDQRNLFLVGWHGDRFLFYWHVDLGRFRNSVMLDRVNGSPSSSISRSTLKNSL